MENFDNTDKEEIFSKRVPAGKRTYFFDVKATRGNELYLTVTESKKRFRDDGSFFYDKHKIFLYQEDFEKFLEGINEAIGYIKDNTVPAAETGGSIEKAPQQHFESTTNVVPSTEEVSAAARITDINFDDLGN